MSLRDRLPWPPGPWDAEPAEVRWLTDAGLPAVVKRIDLGALCGYVGIPAGHPLHGVGYDDAEDAPAHGGLTYAEGHLPREPPDGLWWFGFDCAHAWDLVPALAASMAEAHARTLARFPGGEEVIEGMIPGMVYRDLAYVRGECEQLATYLRQLEEVVRVIGDG